MRKPLLIALCAFFVLAVVLFLRQVFSGRLILAQSFNLGPLAIHYYGVILAVAAGAGIYLAQMRSEKFGLTKKQAEDILFWTVLGGFAGARLYHVLSSAGYYWGHPADILKVWNGGLSIYGAVLGGVAAVAICRKIFNFQFSILNLLNWLAPSVLLGQIIGRLGNLFNYEILGYPANVPWKMFVPEKFRPEQFLGYAYFHPWFLYEAFCNIFVLFILMKFVEKKYKKALFFFYLLLYNIVRFFLEFLRTDSTFVGGLRLNAVVSFVLVEAAVSYLIFQKEWRSTIK